ncbi:MAG: hypothetical protein N2747_11250 [Chitinophagaceae bacterium]|nr:hypothetical protein [Chitinophagaceae bacterium]
MFSKLLQKGMILLHLLFCLTKEMKAQRISSCNYYFPSFGCRMEFACGARIDSSQKHKLNLFKDFRNKSGKLIGFMEWIVLRGWNGTDKNIFEVMLTVEKEFLKNEPYLKLSDGTQQQIPYGPDRFACDDTIYCAMYKRQYVDERLRNFFYYSYVNYSAGSLALFRYIFKKFDELDNEDFEKFRNTFYRYPADAMAFPAMRLSIQLPTGILNTIDFGNKLYLFRHPVHDSTFFENRKFSENEIVALKDYIRVERDAFNTTAAIKTLENRFIQEQKKKGWECFPPKRITIPGSAASEISMIESFRSYRNSYGVYENDSCVYYIMAFPDQKVNPKIPAHIRTIYLIYVPLKEHSWYRKIEYLTRQRIFSSFRLLQQ